MIAALFLPASQAMAEGSYNAEHSTYEQDLLLWAETTQELIDYHQRKNTFYKIDELKLRDQKVLIVSDNVGSGLVSLFFYIYVWHDGMQWNLLRFRRDHAYDIAFVVDEENGKILAISGEKDVEFTLTYEELVLP